MTDITLLGIDLAKNVFQLHGVDDRGNAKLRKKLRRNKLADFVANLSPCIIAMEACGGANYWGRKFQQYGHTVKLISPQYVKPFVKTNKNDQNDAQAITEAASRPSMHFVAVKTTAQQDIQNIHRIRSRLVKQRTALTNQIRGLLAEYGVCIAKGPSVTRKALPDITADASNGLSCINREVLDELYQELCNIDASIERYNVRIKRIVKSDERCQRLMQIPGVGEITATAMVSAVGDATYFKNARQLPAWIGLVPRQCSSGGKERMLGISKRGDCYLRQLLIHGARAVLKQVDRKTDSMSSCWAEKKNRLGMNKAAVALANKNARVIWAMLSRGDNYEVAKYA